MNKDHAATTPSPAKQASGGRVTLSAYLITLNEAAHLDQVLAALDGVDEIIVVDSGSTDATLDIARQRGARVVHQEWLGYARQKAHALSLCTGDWALSVDGDEVFEPGAMAAMRAAMHDPRFRAYHVLRVEVFLGQPLMRARPDKFLRLHRRDVGHWDVNRVVHEHIDVDEPAGVLPVRMIHYGSDGIDKVLRKIGTYARLKAIQKRRRGQSASVLRAVVAPWAYLLKYLLIRRYLLAGFAGFSYAVVQAMYAFLSELHMFEPVDPAHLAATHDSRASPAGGKRDTRQ